MLHCSVVNGTKHLPIRSSDVNKARSLKAKTKVLTLKAKTKAKVSTLKALRVD